MNQTIPSAAVIQALEALEVGDQGHAVALLLSALEDGPTERRFACRVCGLATEWPGLRSHHELLSHGYDHEHQQELRAGREDACAA